MDEAALVAQWLPRRVAVTGGAGFIGTHSVRRLVDEGVAVLVIDDLRHACGEPLPAGVAFEASEVSSAAAAHALETFRPEAVLHLAAQGGVSRSVRDPAGDATINVVGTVALLKAAVDAQVKRFVFASSGGAIYGRAEQLPTPESTIPAPLSPYGAAKLAGEGYLGMFNRTFGLRTIALRYSNVYGPFQDGTGEAGVVAITSERLLTNRPPEIRGDGEQTRDFIFVGDVVEANVRALSSDGIDPLNIGTGVETSVRTIVGELASIAGYQQAISYVEARPGEVRRTALEIGRARQSLGWAPTMPLRQGLHETFRSFQQRAEQHGQGATRGPGAGAARRGPESRA